MKRTLSAVLSLVGLLLAQYAAAQVVLYDQEWLRGRAFIVDAPFDNFAGTGFNDKAMSAVVERGDWEVCEDAYYQGRCVTLRPGQYSSLASFGMSRKISSVRPLSAPPTDQFSQVRATGAVA